MIDPAQYSNILRGEVVYILASGPSLLEVDVERLRGRRTIVVNGAYLAMERADVLPHFFVTSDERFSFSRLGASIAQKAVEAGVPRIVRDKCQSTEPPNVQQVSSYVRALGRDGFEGDLRVGFYYGCTSVMLALQFAVFAGARRAVMIGVDLNYSPSMPRFYREDIPQPIDSFLGVQIWNIAHAARHMAHSGCELISCSAKSRLRPYVKYLPFTETLDLPFA